MNFQDILHEVYDGNQKALKTTATLTGGQATVSLIDPHDFIGLVTVVGSLSAPSGNTTLNPSPNFIGIVTVANSQANTGNVTLNPGPNFIGIVTVANPGSTSGNVTLNGGPNQIGSVTVSNPITVGNAMVTVTLGTKLDSTNDSVDIKSGATVTPKQAWPDPGTYIGLVTITGSLSAASGNVTLDPGSKTQIVGNMTLSGSLPAGVNNIGFATVSVSNPTLYAVVNTGGANTGNITINPGPNQIGSVTVSNPITIGNTPTVFVGTPTLFAVVNTGAVGNTNALATLLSGPNQIGSVTVSNPITIGNAMVTVTLGTKLDSTNDSVDIKSGATVQPLAAWPDPKTYIGLVTITGSLAAASGNVTLDPGSKTQIVGNVTLSDPKGFIGLVTVVGSLSPAAGNVTLDAGSKTQIVGNVTLTDPKTFIGLVTVGGGTAWTDPKTYIGLVTITGSLSAASGNVTLDPGSKTQIVGNVTLTDPKTYIGLVTSTANQGTSPWVTSITGNVTLSDPKGFIGLVTVVGSLSPAAGNVTLDPGSKTQIVGNVTLSDPKTNIGLVTLTGGTAWTDPKTYIGLVTITGSLSPAAGNVTLDPGSKTGIVGNVTLSDAKTYIGLATVTLDNSRNIGLLGNVTISDSKTFIGLTTAILGNNSVQAFGQFFPVLQSIASGGLGPIALDNFGRVQAKLTADPNTYIGLVTVGHTVTVAAHALTAGAAYVGLMTVDIGTTKAWGDPKTYLGLVTAYLANQPALVAGAAYAGLMTVDIGTQNGVAVKGNVTLSDSKAFIGLVTLGGGTAWTDPKTYIGLVTITGSLSAASGNVTLDDGSLTGIVGNVTISDSKAFIGLVTAWTRNAGTTKSLVNIPIAFNTTSVATIAVPTNANILYVTNMILSANATTQVRIKSGVTYLTGNASLGITLNPAGGFVLTGAPDSPSWIGLPSGAFVLEKNDITTQLAGSVVYFQE